MVLSIIVISHNQKDKLRRCIDSILKQQLPFEHEIIISDDASSDGTWELAQEYEVKNTVIKAFQCNTDDYNSVNNSERSGWNRCNGYKHATGKYIAHVDGDDFFIDGTDIYKKQVELLELHPECSCCMANDYELKEDDDISKACLRHKQIMDTGEVLSSETYIRHFFRESHCFVYRRNLKINPVEVCGGFYVDTLLTDFYIQFGDIVCLNEAGLVYVQYKSSIWSNNMKSYDYQLFAHGFYIPIILPQWRHAFFSEPVHLKRMLHVVRMAYYGYKVHDLGNLYWIQKFDLFIYHAFNRKLRFVDKVHLLFLRFYLKCLINNWFPRNSLSCKVLSLLL